MRDTKSTKRRRKPLVRSVISQTSILILSAFLIGNAAGKAVDPAVEVSLYLIGGFGLVAYIGLDNLARRRQQREARRKQKKAARKLEVRMGRHIPRSLPRPLAERKKPAQPLYDDNQFMPVVSSQHAPPA